MKFLLSRLIGSYEIEKNNFRYYDAKRSSCHLKRSDVCCNYILGLFGMLFSGISLYFLVNMSVLLGASIFLLSGSFCYLLFLIKLFVTGGFDDDYSRCKQYFQDEIDYGISAEICRAKSKIFMIALSTLNRIFGGEGCVASDCLGEGVLKYRGDKLIDSEVDKFKSDYSQYSINELNKELKFLECRLDMLYKQLEVNICRKVMYKKLKIRLSVTGSDSAIFRPKNPDNDEIFRQLIFYLSSRYDVGVDSFKGHYPLDSCQAVSRVNSNIREIAFLEIRKVLVVESLEGRAGSTASKPVKFSTIAPIHRDAERTTTEELTTGSLCFAHRRALRI